MNLTRIVGTGACLCILIGIYSCSGHRQNAKVAPPQTVTKSVVSDKAGVVTTRARWPLGVPLYVQINHLPFVDAKSHDLDVTADIPNSEPMTRYLYPRFTMVSHGPDTTWNDHTHLAGTPPAPAEEVNFLYSLTYPEGVDTSVPPNPSGSLSVPVHIGGTIDDLMTGLGWPALDATLKTDLNALLYRRGFRSQGMPRLWIGTYTNCEGWPDNEYPGICHELVRHPHVTFAARIEVIRDEKVVAWAAGWWRGVGQSIHPFEGMLKLTVVDEAHLNSDAKDSTWQLRIKSDPEMALRDFRSTRYWLGEVLVPLRVTDTE